MKVWIDIDNPPQVQYLLPFKRAFEDAGHTAVVDGTRLRHHASSSCASGASSTASSVARQAPGARARRPPPFGARTPSRNCSAATRGRISSSPRRGPRPSQAGRFGKPVFTFIDYEFVDLTVPRRTGSYVVFPDAIDPAVFEQKGFDPTRLIGYSGLKESISFAESISSRSSRSTSAMQQPARRASSFARRRNGRTTTTRSRAISRARCSRPSPREHDVQLVLTPRYAHQAAYVDPHEWAQQPIVLASPCRSSRFSRRRRRHVLRRDDAPRGRLPRHSRLQHLPQRARRRRPAPQVAGRLHFVERASDLDSIIFEPAGPLVPAFPPGRELVDQLVAQMVARS